MGLADFIDVPDVPDVDRVVVVDHGHLEVGLVQDDGRGVGIPGVGRMRGHVVDGQTLRHVNPEVMSPGNYIS